MKILYFLLKSADSQVPFLLRPIGWYEAITKKIARIANPALCFLLQRIFSYTWMLLPSACCVITWLSVDTFHSVVFIVCNYYPGNPGNRPSFENIWHSSISGYKISQYFRPSRCHIVHTLEIPWGVQDQFYCQVRLLWTLQWPQEINKLEASKGLFISRK